MAKKLDSTESTEPGTETEETENSTPSYITADELDKRLNGALVSHSKRQMASIEKTLSKLVSEAITAVVPKQEPQDEGKKSEDHNRYKSMEAQLKELQDKLANAEKARADEQAARLAEEEKRELSSALRAGGVSDEHYISTAMAVLSQNKPYSRAEDGKLVWKIDKGEWVEEQDLGTGVKSWLQSPAGKMFLPPSGATGSGAKPVAGDSKRVVKRDTGKKSEAQLLRELKWAMDAHRGMITEGDE